MWSGSPYILQDTMEEEAVDTMNRWREENRWGEIRKAKSKRG